MDAVKWQDLPLPDDKRKMSAKELYISLLALVVEIVSKDNRQVKDRELPLIERVKQAVDNHDFYGESLVDVREILTIYARYCFDEKGKALACEIMGISPEQLFFVDLPDPYWDMDIIDDDCG